MKYSPEFEEKVKKVTSMMNSVRGKDEDALVNTINSIANFEDVWKDNPEKRDRYKGTKYSPLTMKELLNTFKKDKFNGMEENDMTLLFQELYNREAKMNDSEPRYIVEMNGGAKDSYNGYMTPSQNVVAINKYLVNKYINELSDNPKTKNASNVGPSFAYTLIHETQHTAQMDGVLNFCLGTSKNKDDEARNALTILRSAVRSYAASTGNFALSNYIREKYWFDIMEHGANMAPVRFVNKAIKNNWIEDQVFVDALKMRTRNDIHIGNTENVDEANRLVNQRILDMETVINKYRDVMSKNFKDGPMKQKLEAVIAPYMKVDENGRSPFRESMKNEFNMCVDFIFNGKLQTKTENKEETEVFHF